MMEPIQVQNVSFAYHRDRPVLRDISFTLPAGAFLAVVGPNGAGKSTLINLIAGLLAPQSGTITVDGVDINDCRPRELARRIAIVRQESVPAFGFSVAEMVLMARTAHYGPLGFESEIDREHVAKALRITDTAEFASRPLASLSGGERQRVFIARALAQDTPILLMDEPTSFLDLRHQVGVYDLLKRIQLERPRTVVAITQDINLALQYCDRALLLRPLSYRRDPPETTPAQTEDPQCRIGPTSEVLTREHVEDAFGVNVFSGRIGKARFFMPLGSMAMDSASDDTPHGSDR
jgi:iron complex transport system ATP-binding protein